MPQRFPRLSIHIPALFPLAAALALLAPAAAPLLAASPGARAAPSRPNIVFLLIDDLRWDALGYTGHPVVRTPAIDRLARAGIDFRNAFCTTSICATSRASFLTGQYERRHGIVDFRTPLSEAAFAKSYPALLRAGGYRVAFIGKWGLGGPLPEKQFDFWRGFSGQGHYYQKGREKHLTDQIRDWAIEFLDSAPADRPFCLQVSTKAAHCQDGDPWQFQPARRLASLYDGVKVEPPSIADEGHYRALPEFLRDSEARRRWKIRFQNEAMYQRTVKDYLRLVTGVDELVAALVEKLEAEGVARNTVIIFTGDNGFYLGDRGLAGKWFPHEESIRLPLFIYDPRDAVPDAGRLRSEMALNIDIAPTILALAGLPIPPEMQGRSLVPLLRGESVEWREDWLYEHRFAHRAIPRSEAVRGRRWKYVRYTDRKPPFEQLFDLAYDPLEERDLARDPSQRARLQKLRARWRELSAKAR